MNLGLLLICIMIFIKYDKEDSLSFMTRKGYKEYLYCMFIVDFIIANRDRHGANIELLKLNNNYRLSPLYDYGLSLLFSFNSEKEYMNYDPLKDMKVNNYFGFNSLYKNLELIPKKYLFKIKKLNENDKEYLFKDIDEIMPKSWVNAVFNMLNKRIEYYEHFRNKK